MKPLKLAIFLAVLLGVAVGVVWIANRPGGDGEGAGGPEPEGAAPAGPPSDYERDPSIPIRRGTVEPLPVPEEPVPMMRVMKLAEALQDPEGTVEEDLEIVAELLRHHQRHMNAMPSGGLNEEIVAGLRGRNSRKMIFIADTHVKLNEIGQLLDRFGTPYFFHPVSEKEIQVRSAGPDRKLWTKDDVFLGRETVGLPGEPGDGSD